MLKLLGFILLSAQLFQSQQIDWLRNLGEAKLQATVENKLILLYFESTSSERSLKMDMETWNQPPIVQIAKKFVCVRIDFEQMRQSANIILKDRNQSLITRYRVTYLPTLVFIDIHGHVFLRAEDFESAQEMKTLMQALPTDLSNVYPTLTALEKEPDNVRLKIAVADSFQRLRQFQISNEYYREMSNADTLKIDQELAEHVDMYTAMNHYELNELHASIDLFERVLDKYPGSKHHPEQLFMLAKLYLLTLNDIRAREYLDMLEKEYPKNYFTHLARGLFKK